MVKKKVGKKAAPKRKAASKKAAPKRKAAKKANSDKPLTSGLDDTFQNWVNKQVAIINKKKR